MRNLLSALIALILTAVCIAADEGPTIEQVAANPAKFEGKALVFKGVQVSGKVFEGPKQTRLTVKSKDGTIIHDKLRKDGIAFVIPKDKAPEMTKGWKADQFYPATLTCKIEKTEKGFWLAMVQKLDPVTPGPSTSGAKSKTAVVVAEGVGKTADDALKDAFRNAVRQVVGVTVDGETIKDDDSAGIVKKYEEVSKKDEKGLVRIKIKATVELATKKDKKTTSGTNERKKTPVAVVIAEGVGTTADDAVKDAFRNAVRQVVGAMVDAEALIKNDEVISDKVLTYSAGIVKKYEEISKKGEQGLVRIKIKATVEQTELVAKLKAAQVTIKDVDGNGLFAQVVTGLEAENDAKALLSKKLKEYRASIVKAEAVGEPQVKKKGESETTIEYNVRLSTDTTKYDKFCEELLPVLQKAAKAKGQVRMEGRKAGTKGAVQSEEAWVIGSGLKRFVGSSSRVLALRAVDAQGKAGTGFGGIWNSSHDAVWEKQGGTRRRKSAEDHLVVLCTERTRLDDRLTWAWFVVPKTVEKASPVHVHISLVDAQGKEITSNTVPLTPTDMPGLYQPTSGDQRDDLILAPYLFRCGSSWLDWRKDRIATDVVVKVPFRVATPDLKLIKEIRCKVQGEPN